MTTAQRARLVVAMGLLNLILATVALTAGVVAPTRPNGDVAVGSPGSTINPASPNPSGPISSSTPPGASPSVTPGASLEPTPVPSAVAPSVEPPAIPSTTPSASTETPTEPPIVAVVPTPTPRVDAPRPNPTTATPTTKPTAAPTPRPTPKPTATPKPAAGKAHKAKPPCPDHGNDPPGHRKTAQPDRPCKGGSGHGNEGGNGMVVILPLVIGTLGAGIRTRFVVGSRRLGSRSRRMPGGQQPLRTPD